MEQQADEFKNQLILEAGYVSTTTLSIAITT